MTAPSAVPPAQVVDERTEPLGDRAMLVLAGLIYLLVTVLITWWLWRDPASRMVTGNDNDTDQMAWFFRYEATAVGHLRLPALVTTGMNAPLGINVMWNPSILLPGVLLAPVTLLAGVQTSLTVMMTIGFAGSALAMFAVLRYWGVSRPAALLGGAVYGFSPALLHSAIGHLDLQFAAMLPLIVDAAFRLLAGRVTLWRGGVRLGLLVTAQLLIDEEMLLDVSIVILILAAALALRPSRPWSADGAQPVRARLVVRGTAVAAGVVLLLAGYPLWIQFFGPLPQSGSPFALDFFKDDLSGLIVPSGLMLFHGAGGAAAAASFQGQLPEYLAYLGVPLILVLLQASVRFWRRPVIRALAVTWLVTETFSLGGTLLAAAHEHSSVKLPWYWLQGLPLLSSVLPDRFSIVADGAAAALLAFVIDAAVPVAASAARREMERQLRHPARWQLRHPARWQPWLAARWLPALASGRGPVAVVLSVAVLAALPLAPKPLPATAATALPDGWTTVFAELRLPASAPVLVVPVATATFTSSLRWQADTGAPQALIGGYFLGPAGNGHVYVDGNGTPPAGLYLNALWSLSAASIPASLSAQFPPDEAASAATQKVISDAQFRAQLKAWHPAAVVAVTTAGSPLAQYLTAELGHVTVTAGDVMAWRGLNDDVCPLSCRQEQST